MMCGEPYLAAAQCQGTPGLSMSCSVNLCDAELKEGVCAQPQL